MEIPTIIMLIVMEITRTVMTDELDYYSELDNTY